MRLIKYTHACVRLEHAAGVLVIDPGVWSEPDALVGADVALLTHAHSDHADVLRLAGSGVHVIAPVDADLGPVAERLGLVTTRVSPGEVFEAAGFRVRAVGGHHGRVYDERPVANLGYVVDGRVLHPGDSLHVPAADEIDDDGVLDVLLAPVHGSWQSTRDLLEYVVRVAPRRVVGIHENRLRDGGLASVVGWLRHAVGDALVELVPGEGLELPPPRFHTE